jgi:peptide/nickel transport system permease protein
MVASHTNRHLSKTPLQIWRQRLRDILTSEISAYIFKRFLQAIVTLFLASILYFVIIQLAPGDYADTVRANPTLSPERQEEYVRQFLLDRPANEQYLGWLLNILGFEFKQGWWGLWFPTWSPAQMGNFGTSFIYGRSVASLLWERIPNTLLLSIASLIVTWGIAIPLGIVAAVHQNRWIDKVLQVVSYAGQGFPSFITALLFLIFAQSTPFFPVGNMTSLDFTDFTPLGKILDIGWHMILPTLALSVTSFAGLQRITRGNLLDVLRQNYIQTARAKGLPENRVIYLHALRNAVNPLVTLLGFEFAGLLGGAFIAEFFFNWPGLGRLILQALLVQDLYLVMGSLMLGAVMLIVGNLLADVLLKLVDPRIKLDANT